LIRDFVRRHAGRHAHRLPDQRRWALHVVPVLFGGGTRMFEDLHTGHVPLEVVDVLSTPSATHLRYRIAR
jgi:hypothetical protein